MIYVPGKTTPSDYGSRHPLAKGKFSRKEKEELGVEEEEKDAEIIVSRLEMVVDAVTLPLLARYRESRGRSL